MKNFVCVSTDMHLIVLEGLDHPCLSMCLMKDRVLSRRNPVSGSLGAG